MMKNSKAESGFREKSMKGEINENPQICHYHVSRKNVRMKGREKIRKLIHAMVSRKINEE